MCVCVVEWKKSGKMKGERFLFHDFHIFFLPEIITTEFFMSAILLNVKYSSWFDLLCVNFDYNEEAIIIF